MVDFFKEKFEYNHAVNDQIIHTLLSFGPVIPERAGSLMSHILNAHEIWNARIEERAWKCGVWEVHDLNQCLQINDQANSETLRLLQKRSLDTVIKYRTTEGKEHESRVSDILFHIVNHGTYHRGQIALNLREAELTPVSTDYIFYRR